MQQSTLNFDRPVLTPQSQRLLDRLQAGPITNFEMRDQLRLLSYTRRLSDLREQGIRIKKEYIKDGVFKYSLEEEDGK
jgi:hypothetical protein